MIQGSSNQDPGGHDSGGPDPGGPESPRRPGVTPGPDSAGPDGPAAAVPDAAMAPRPWPDAARPPRGGRDGPAPAAPDASMPRRRRPQPTPVQRALGLLVRREHSRKELARKLAVRGVEADEAAAAVERLASEGWQDDTRFAESLVRGRAMSGYGPIYIRAELGTHGLGSEAIAAALETFGGDWVEVARDLVRRCFGESGPLDLAQRRKAADLLARRGFDGDSIRVATRRDPAE